MAEDKPRRVITLRRLAILAGVAAVAGAVMHASPLAGSARGKPSAEPGPQATEAGYEPRDISVPGAMAALGVMGITTAVVIAVVFAMVWHFDATRHRIWSRLTPEQTARVVPPPPHLQIAPFDDLAKLRAQQDNLLHSYAWTSADHSTARIPIERAMALAVGKSLDAPP
jgi:hypothetical protein